jgi:hypothetical protein
MNQRTKNNTLVILGGLLIAAICISIALLTLYIFRNNNPTYSYVTPDVKVITAPTLTKVSLTPTIEATAELSLPGSMSIPPGTVVEITGTEGSGLRVRDGAGTTATPLFLAMDGERYTVKEGPKHADDLFWYRIVSNDDPTRKGWAAADYLKVITNP